MMFTLSQKPPRLQKHDIGSQKMNSSQLVAIFTQKTEILSRKMLRKGRIKSEEWESGNLMGKGKRIKRHMQRLRQAWGLGN